MKNVLVVEDNKEFIELLKDYFKNNPSINIKYTSNDGEEGIKKLRDNYNDIDLVLLDLVLPNRDGICFLEDAKKYDLDTDIIVMTSFSSDSLIKKVSNYGVDYFLLKPFMMKDLENRIYKVFETPTISAKSHSNLKVRLTKLLHELGVPSHIKGYEYIREGIIKLYENPNIIGGITKELYPEIADKYDSSVSRVERAIRHAIEVSWNRGNLDLMEEIFGHSVDIDRAKPTNSEFIVTLADKLKLEYQLS